MRTMNAQTIIELVEQASEIHKLNIDLAYWQKRALEAEEDLEVLDKLIEQYEDTFRKIMDEEIR